MQSLRNVDLRYLLQRGGFLFSFHEPMTDQNLVNELLHNDDFVMLFTHKTYVSHLGNGPYKGQLIYCALFITYVSCAQ